jgi:hypothetical protein
MATVSQIKLQLSSPVKYTNGEAVLPPPPSPGLPSQLVIAEGVQADGTDLGIVKVENGKLVLDMADFNPDFGTYQ